MLRGAGPALVLHRRGRGYEFLTAPAPCHSVRTVARPCMPISSGTGSVSPRRGVLRSPAAPAVQMLRVRGGVVLQPLNSSKTLQMTPGQRRRAAARGQRGPCRRGQHQQRIGPWALPRAGSSLVPRAAVAVALGSDAIGGWCEDGRHCHRR